MNNYTAVEALTRSVFSDHGASGIGTSVLNEIGVINLFLLQLTLKRAVDFGLRVFMKTGNMK